jgi:hypothetical protein
MFVFDNFFPFAKNFPHLGKWYSLFRGKSVWNQSWSPSPTSVVFRWFSQTGFIPSLNISIIE